MGDKSVNNPAVPNTSAVAKTALVSPPLNSNVPAVGVPKSKKWFYWVGGAIVVVVILVIFSILVFSSPGGGVANILGGGQRGALEDAYYDFNVPSNCYGDRFESLDACESSFKCISRKFADIVREEDIGGLIDQISISGNSAVAAYLNDNPSLNAEFEADVSDCES